MHHPGNTHSFQTRRYVAQILGVLLCCGLTGSAIRPDLAQSRTHTCRAIATPTVVAAPGHGFVNTNNTSTYQNQYGSGTYRKRYICTSDATGITMAFGNQFCEWNQLPLPTLAPIQVRASIEYPVGSPRTPLTFIGNRTLSLQPLQITQSDPLPLTLHKGDVFYLWVYVQGAIWPTGPGMVPTSPFNEGFTPGQDLTTGTARISPAITFAYAPMLVLGTPTSGQSVPVIGILGDSIAAGNGDYINRGGANQVDLGYIVRALAPGGTPGLNDQYGYVRINKSGEKLENLIQPSMHYLRFALLEHCTHAICEGGIPDLAWGTGVWDMEQYLLTEWQLLANMHIKVYQCTYTPHTLSQDQWMTTQGQRFPDAKIEAVRVALNNWLRDTTRSGAIARSNGTLKGVFDIADQAETYRSSGIWRPGYTNDGQHPNNYGAALVKNAIDLRVLNR